MEYPLKLLNENTDLTMAENSLCVVGFPFLCTLTNLIVVFVLVWTTPDLPDEKHGDPYSCLDTEQGIECGQKAAIFHECLEKLTEKGFSNRRKVNDAEMKKYFNNENARKLLTTEYWEMKPTARVTGKYMSQSNMYDYNFDMVPIKHWCHESDSYNQNVFLRNGVTYRNGRLVVPVSGTYLIYAFVDFSVPGVQDTSLHDMESPNRHIQLGIYKFNILNGKDIELTRGTKPCGQYCNKRLNYFSSYVNDIVILSAGDELSVKVNNLEYLSNTRNNYFGVNLI